MATENLDSSFGTIAKGFGLDMASSAGKGLISTLFNNHAQKRALEANKDLMREQAMYQYQNNLNAGQVTKQSKQRAGMNVNTAGDFSPSLTPPQSNSPALGADINGGSSLIPSMMLLPAQAEQMKANARLTNAEAGLKERQLRGENEADTIFTEQNFETGTYLNPESGQEEFVIKLKRDTPITTKEGFEALEKMTKFFRNDLPTYKANEAQAFLQKYIAQEQITSGVWKKIAQMEGQQFDNMVQELANMKALNALYWKNGELMASETELNKLQKTIQENSNLGAIFDDIKKDFENENYLSALGGILKAIFFGFMGAVGFNFGFNRGSVTSRSTSNSTVNSTSRSTVNSTSNSTVRHINGNKP